MSDGAVKGNNPDLWQKLLAELDEKLQLGLLDRMKRVRAYHFESDTLFIELGNEEDEKYFKNGGSFQHLELIAQDATRVREVRLRTK